MFPAPQLAESIPSSWGSLCACSEKLDVAGDYFLLSLTRALDTSVLPAISQAVPDSAGEREE